MSELEELKEIEQKALYGQDPLVPPAAAEVQSFVNIIRSYLDNKPRAIDFLTEILINATNSFDQEEKSYSGLKDGIFKIISFIENWYFFDGCHQDIKNLFRYCWQILLNIEQIFSQSEFNRNFQCVRDCLRIGKLFDIGQRKFPFDCDFFQVIANIRAIQISKSQLYESEKTFAENGGIRENKGIFYNNKKASNSFIDQFPITITLNWNGETKVFEFIFNPKIHQPLNGIIKSMNQHLYEPAMKEDFCAIAYPKNENEYYIFKDEYCLKLILLAFEVVRRDCEKDSYEHLPVISCLLMLDEISLNQIFFDVFKNFWTKEFYFHIFSGENRNNQVTKIINIYKKYVLKADENIDLKVHIWNKLENLSNETIEEILLQ